MLILALVVVVIGGLGSVRGALVGALIIGQVDTLGRVLLPELASFLLFAALALVLVLRPQGLFGGPVGGGCPVTAVESPAVPGGAAAATPRAPRGRAGLVAVAVLVVLAAVPLFLAPFATTTLTRILVFALFAVSLDLLVGVTGLPVARARRPTSAPGPTPPAGSRSTSRRRRRCRCWSGPRSGRWPPRSPAGSRSAAAGVFFLMLTLAIGETVQQLADTWESVTGGANGLTGIPAVRIGRGAARQRRVRLLVRAGGRSSLGFALVWLVARSPFGAALRGIRDNEPRMRALGYPTALYKYAVFVLAGGVAGLAGSLLVAQQRLVTPADLGFTDGVVRAARGDHRRRRVAVGRLPRRGAGDRRPRRARPQPRRARHAACSASVFVLVVYLLPRGAAGLAAPAADGRDVTVLRCTGSEPVVRRAQGRRRRRPRGRSRAPGTP